MRCSLILAACLATGFTVGVAQDPTPKPPEEIRKDIRERERAMREGRMVRSNVRITVRLKNGSKMAGVVRNGRFIERHDGLMFVPSDVRAEGAGVRLWYFNETNSYVFLPFETIREHTIGKVLSDEEVREIGLKFDLAERERQARLQAARARRAEEGQDGGKGKDKSDGEAGKDQQEPKPGAGGDSGVPELTKEQQALLSEFPPGKDWYPEKLEELERRKIVLGVFPNEKEQRFMDNFAQWNEAYEVWRQIQQARAGRPAPQGTPPAPGDEPSPKPGSKPPAGGPGPKPDGVRSGGRQTDGSRR